MANKIGSKYGDVFTGGDMPPKLSPYELAAGVTAPTRYEGITGTDGNLKGQFRIDPYAGRAMQELQGQAFGQGPSAWAGMQTQAQQLEQQKAMNDAAKSGQQAMSTARSGLARTGGVTGGASALLAKSGMRDQMMAKQDIAGQGVGQRLNIGQQDLERKTQLLGKFGDMENQANITNVSNAQQDITRRSAFDANRYNQQMSAWGAKETAQGMRASGGGGGKK